AARQSRSLRHALQVLAESFHSSPAAFAGQCEELPRRFRKLLPAGVEGRLRHFQDLMTPELLSGKVGRAAEILRRSALEGGGKVLVFTQYDDTADGLVRDLPALTGLAVARYPGPGEGEEDGT